MKKYGIILFLSLVSFTSCQSQNKTYKTIAPAAFAQKIENDKTAQLLDVRTPQEYTEAHLTKAQNSNWNSDDFLINVAKLDKSKPVLVYCKIGGRSAKAAQKLTELGFKDVLNLDGGIDNWTAAGLPTSK